MRRPGIVCGLVFFFSVRDCPRQHLSGHPCCRSSCRFIVLASCSLISLLAPFLRFDRSPSIRSSVTARAERGDGMGGLCSGASFEIFSAFESIQYTRRLIYSFRAKTISESNHEFLTHRIFIFFSRPCSGSRFVPSTSGSSGVISSRRTGLATASFGAHPSP